MSKFIKLPDELKSWKINSLVSESDSNELYKITKKKTSAFLRHISAQDEEYNEDNINYLLEEAKFLQTISSLYDGFNYIDIISRNNTTKEVFDLYIVTKDAVTLDDYSRTHRMSEAEIVDFGIKMSNILEKLESKNIFHGNISPKNIYVTDDNKYILGGFSDFESKIDDLGFVAPEIAQNKDADFTTDLYSLGLIMYYLANKLRLPFEGNGILRDKAIQMRLDGDALNAPLTCGEKLISVIVIACQSSNQNRWKNAGNVKNALMSIQSELPKVNSENTVSDDTENTDFESNVFEEYGFDEYQPENTDNEDKDDKKESLDIAGAAVTAGVAASVAASVGAAQNQAEELVPDATKEGNLENANETLTNLNAEETPQEETPKEEVSENTNTTENTNESAVDTSDTKTPENFDVIQDNAESSDNDNSFEEFTADAENAESLEDIDTNTQNTDEPVVAESPLGNEVFEDLESTKTNNDFDRTSSSTDYGDFFDEDKKDENDSDKTQVFSVSTDEKDADTNVEEINEDKSENDTFDDDVFNEDENTEEKHSNKKRNNIIIGVSIAIIVLALGFVTFCIVNGIIKNNNKKVATTSATTQVVTTQKPSTAQVTTEEATTEKPYKEVTVTPVVGYGYSYGKELLEAQGFTVEIGEYKYSSLYGEGYIIAQSPEGDTTAKNNGVVTLDISLGLETVETTAEPETVSATQAPTKSSSSSSSAKSSNTSSKTNNFIFSNSDSSYLSTSDVKDLSRNNLNIALNEIYARRGRIFTDSSLADYFNSQSWYTPLYSASEFSQKVNFNKYEQANLQLIVNEQKDKGYR